MLRCTAVSKALPAIALRSCDSGWKERTESTPDNDWESSVDSSGELELELELGEFSYRVDQKSGFFFTRSGEEIWFHAMMDWYYLKMLQ